MKKMTRPKSYIFRQTTHERGFYVYYSILILAWAGGWILVWISLNLLLIIPVLLCSIGMFIISQKKTFYTTKKVPLTCEFCRHHFTRPELIGTETENRVRLMDYCLFTRPRYLLIDRPCGLFKINKIKAKEYETPKKIQD